MATLMELAVGIVEAHVGTTPMTTDQMLKEIQEVYSTLKNLESGVEAAPVAEEAKPTMTYKQSIKANEIICLICGKGGMKTLTRHLNTVHEMKPGEYRKQFGIPSKQPLAAKKFSEERRAMAQERGLGDVLAKAREVRMANLQSKKATPTKKKAAKGK